MRGKEKQYMKTGRLALSSVLSGRCLPAGTSVSAFDIMLPQLYNGAKYYHGVEEYG
jgi:hypothetical protein